MTKSRSDKTKNLKPFIIGAIGILLVVGFNAYSRTETSNRSISIERAVLNNGMEIIVIPYDRAPTLTHMIWYKIGGADEPKGQSGIAHLFEHLMFKATKNRPAGEFSKTVAALGGQDNAMTMADFTAYYQRIPKQHLETVIAMEADRMVNLRLSADDFETEKRVVLEERSLRVDTRPQALANEKIRTRLYQNHPYGIPVIGWRDEVENMPYQAAKIFYDNYYAPQQALMVVVGDTHLDEVVGFAKKHFGIIPASQAQRPKRPAIDFLKPLKDLDPVVFEDARLQQFIWQQLTRITPLSTENKREMLALDMGIHILGGGSNSRLYRRLIRQDKTANYVAADVNILGINAIEVSVFAVAENDTQRYRMEAAIKEEIEQMRQILPTNAEISRAVSALAADELYAMDGQASMAFNFGFNLALGNDLDDLNDYPKLLSDISGQEIQQAMNKHIRSDQSVIAHLMPKTQ